MMSSTATPTSRHPAGPGPQGTQSMPTRRLASLGQILRFMMRRDRLRAPVWIVSIIGFVAVGTSSVIGLYSSPSELQNYADLAQSDVAIKAITGPGYGLDHPTQGAVVMNEMQIFAFLALALMCMFLLIRHTRAEEETDRAELVHASPVGRYTTLTAACIWVTVISLVVALGSTLALLAMGLDTAGSVAFGAAGAGLALVMIAVTAVAGQIATTARGASALAGATLGGFFLLRAVGDMGNEWATWISPLGWAQAIRAYADERWWVLLPLLGAAAALMLGAIRLSARRDLGAGLLRQRPGPAEASRGLSSPLGMAFRLQRNSLIGWAIGVGILGLLFGILADQTDTLLENQAIADILAQAGQGSPAESFLATIVLLTGLLASGFTISSMLRLRTEEQAGRAETTLAGPVSRQHWALSYVTIAVVGSLVVTAFAGLMAGLGYAIRAQDAGEILPLIGAALLMGTALFVLAGFAFAIFGLSARWAPLAWAGVALTAVVGLLGDTLDLPQPIRNLSPFEHLPSVPAESFAPLPVVILLLIGAALTALGALTLKRRDIG